MRTIGEGLLVKRLQSPASVGTTANTKSVFADTTGYSEALVIIQLGAVTDTGTIEVMQATDASGTGAVALSPADVLAYIDTEDNTVAIFDINLQNLTAGYEFVGLNITNVAAALLSSVIVLGGGNYLPVPTTGYIS